MKLPVYQPSEFGVHCPYGSDLDVSVETTDTATESSLEIEKGIYIILPQAIKTSHMSIAETQIGTINTGTECSIDVGQNTLLVLPHAPVPVAVTK